MKAGLWKKHGCATWKGGEGHDLALLLEQFEIEFRSIAAKLRELPFLGLSLKFKATGGSGSRLTDASVAYRYPVDSEGREWSNMEFFHPENSFEELFELGEVMTQLEQALGDFPVPSDSINAP